MARKNIIEILIKADDKASKEFNTVGKNASQLGKRVVDVAKIIATAGVAVGAALTAIIVKTSEWGDKIAKNAQKIGVTTEFLSEMEHAVKISGATIDDFTTGMRRLSKTAWDAFNGLETGTRAFDTLGISIKDSNGELKDSEKLFYEVADAIARIENDTLRAAIAQEVFGRGGANLIPLLNQGSAGIRELRGEAQRLGVSLAGEDAKNMEAFQDAVTDIRDALKGLAIAVTSDYGPSMTTALKEITNYIVEIEETKKGIADVFKFENAWDFMTKKPLDPANLEAAREKTREEAEKIKSLVENMHQAITDYEPSALQFSIAPPPPVNMSAYKKGVEEINDIEQDRKAALAKEEAAVAELVRAYDELQTRKKEAAEGWIVNYPTMPEVEGPQPDIFEPAIRGAEQLRKLLADTVTEADDLSVALEDVPEIINRAAEEADRAADQIGNMFDYSGEDILVDLNMSFGNALEMMLSNAKNKTQQIERLFASMVSHIIVMLAKVAVWHFLILPLLQKGGEFTGAKTGLEFIGGQKGLELLGAQEGLQFNFAQRGLEAMSGQYFRDTIPVMITRGEVVSPSPHVERVEQFMKETEHEGGGDVYFITPFVTGSMEERLGFGAYSQPRINDFGKFVVRGTL